MAYSWGAPTRDYPTHIPCWRDHPLVTWLTSWITWRRDLRRDVAQLKVDVQSIRMTVLGLPTALIRMEKLMADTSALLNDVAAGLTALGQPVADLIAENAALAAENASLKGEDAAESQAATNVKTAFDELAGKFTKTPDVPDVPPLPETPVDGGDTAADPNAPVVANPGGDATA